MSRPPPQIRRIVVALDASADSLAGLEAAVQLAADLRAEVLGVFVEETDLLRAGELPATREVTLFSGEPRELDRDELERQIRAQAKRARKALEAAAERARIAWSFRTVRGRPGTELAAAAEEADLLTVGATGRAPWRAPGTTVRELVRVVDRPMLVLRQGAPLGPDVQVVHDGSEAGWEALRTGAALAGREEARLTVLVTPADPDEAAALRESVEERLAEAGLSARFRHLPGAGVTGICAALAEADGGVLVAPGLPFREEQRTLGRLLRSAGCPVLLVGEGRGEREG